ncbi:Predicted PurR-regulated permease PerM [Loktanella atrilutea]|uniref:Predicted PurR-regulated permease PerM n=1 Tax=Loktanella atrilutea TaxID=366533 RepID=A0A1M4V8F1_LOKAT|nr:AI-2E family transporter [Loktanella atrilutea]SHE65271.1 Predicted PurR-regulated permease PerM [Loktanella atrilutea]
MKHTPLPEDTTDRRFELARVQTAALVIIAFAVVLFLLVQARFILISLAVAIILFSLTADIISFIARQRIGPVRIPNWIASIVALLLIGAALLSVTSIIAAQVNTILQITLAYAERAPDAIAALFAWAGADTQAAVLNSMRTIELSGYLRGAAGGATSLTQGTVLVILFVGFLFAERVWFQTKLLNFTGSPAQAVRVGRIISSIIHRVNYYLLVKTGISLVTGAMTWGLARAFGMEVAMPLGVITFVLNFIPNVGSIVATGLVALAAYVQFGDPWLTGVIFAIAGGIQFVNGSIIDPMLMGRALRLSSFGILLSLAFWGAVWGVPGMFLSVPIMVMLLVVCSHVQALRPIAILLSREGLPESEGLLDRDTARDLR